MFTLVEHNIACASPGPEMAGLILDGGFCVGVVRRSWGLPSLGASALEAVRAVPHGELHHTDPLDVPLGAICYGLNGLYGQPFYQFGHCWTATDQLQAFTTDYVAHGTFQRAPMSLPRWTGDSKVQWTSWTPGGHIPVGSTQRQRDKAANTKVHGSNKGGDPTSIVGVVPSPLAGLQVSADSSRNVHFAFERGLRASSWEVRNSNDKVVRILKASDFPGVVIHGHLEGMPPRKTITVTVTPRNAHNHGTAASGSAVVPA